MKRACSFEYTSDEEDDALLAQALDDFERQDDALLAQALDEFEQTGGAMDQLGGASPLFAFTFEAVGQRRRWRNVVQGQSFCATLHQQRDAREGDNIGEALTEALRVAINREL